jgi:hypothetical protein
VNTVMNLRVLKKDSAPWVSVILFYILASFILDYLRRVNTSGFCPKRTRAFILTSLFLVMCVQVPSQIRRPLSSARKCFATTTQCALQASVFPTEGNSEDRQLFSLLTFLSTWCPCVEPWRRFFHLEQLTSRFVQTQTTITHLILWYSACYFQQRLNCQFRGFTLQNSLL